MRQVGFLSNVFLLMVIASLSACSDEQATDEESGLWPEIEPYQTGYLKVSDIHEIYYELCGNPEGIPVFVLHGGPGAGCGTTMRRFFDPEKYLVVLYDQRGCGRSRPVRELRENTTQALVEDIEQLRNHLGLDKIVLFGGSWGTTLSLAYAETYPESTEAIILRAVYLATRAEAESYYPRLKLYFPEEYQECLELAPDSLTELNDTFYYALGQAGSREMSDPHFAALDRLESKAVVLNYVNDESDTLYSSGEYMEWLNTLYVIAYHYMVNSCFLSEGQLLDNAGKLRDIPITIVHGRYDMVCPPYYAYQLHKALPGSKLVIAEEAGHYLSDKPIERELVKAMKELEANLK